MNTPNKLPIFEMDINEDDSDETGISTISLVQKPAIGTDFLKFSRANKITFAIQDKTRQIVSGPIMIPDMLIYRSDERGQYYVTASKDNIYKALQKHARTGNPSNVNLEHGQEGTASGCYLFESFIIDSTRGISCPAGFDLPEGTWFGSMKIEDPDVWQSVMDGTFNGFSLEGLFNLAPVSLHTNEMELFKELKSILEGLDID